MCGIVGIVGREQNVTERLLEGLKRLEYRGYDSAGIAVINGNGIARRRAAGRIANLEEEINHSPVDGLCGIAHTRWATHGKPTRDNAHPHIADQVAVVHNGIIENFKELRKELQGKGRIFTSETDSETIPQMLAELVAQGMNERDAFFAMVDRLHGAFGIAALFASQPDTLYAARHNVPLIVGIGEDEGYVGSDAFALAPFTRQVIFLEEGDRAIVTPEGAQVFDAKGTEVSRPVKTAKVSALLADKGNYDHFMQKEIFEQPESVARTLAKYVDALSGALLENPVETDFTQSDRTVAIACGTAYYAACVGKHWMENLAGLHMETDVASEFRYRHPALPEKGPALFVSQSGETADTQACLKYSNRAGLPTYAVVNVPESSIARDAKGVLPTAAGPEIGVASTKAFTTQLVALAACALLAARARNRISTEKTKKLVSELESLPHAIAECFKLEEGLKHLAYTLRDASHILFMGRGIYHPIAMEGALKMKEITYLKAEGYAAGELKHGPIALIEEGTPVIIIAPYDELGEKTFSNMEEVISRGAHVHLFTDAKGADLCQADIASITVIPDCGLLSGPVIASIPLQLLAYHTAGVLGTDVDKPRNLAKSVTVE